jgi:RNA methyltransferase, TrmH family
LSCSGPEQVSVSGDAVRHNGSRCVECRVFSGDFRFVAGVKRKEITVCGLAAVKAQFESNPKAMVRLFFDQSTGRKIGAICKALAHAKKIYRCVEPAELEKIAGSIHHGGIVAIIESDDLRAPAAGAAREWARRRDALLVLDRVGNAHNLGAIVRTAAYFGLPRIIIPDDAAAAQPGDAAHRVAEGGMAQVEILRVRSLPAFLRELTLAGYDVVGAATRGGGPEVKGPPGKPMALVLGNEEHGLAPAVLGACSRLVTLPGSGKVESLNVSVAAAILMWELVARR